MTVSQPFAYTTGALGTALDTISYGYGDSEWRDLLTSYDGKRLTADEIGNLRNDGKWSYTWRRGRILWDMSRMVDEDAELFEAVQYRYDSNGRRIGKTYGDSYNFRIAGGQLYCIGDSTGTSYYYAGDDLSQINITFPDNSSTSLHFTYDEIGPMSVTYDGAEYFYLKNAQGDVTGLVNSSGTQVGRTPMMHGVIPCPPPVPWRTRWASSTPSAISIDGWSALAILAFGVKGVELPSQMVGQFVPIG